jgi:hypothetical protein
MMKGGHRWAGPGRDEEIARAKALVTQTRRQIDELRRIRDETAALVTESKRLLSQPVAGKDPRRSDDA